MQFFILYFIRRTNCGHPDRMVNNRELRCDLAESQCKTKAWGAAATIYTPNGTLISDTYYRSEEMSASQKASTDEYWTTRYSQATLISGSTTTYNCHAYA